VLYEHNVVGTLVSGRVGAQVRLVTDKQSRIRARFGSFRSIDPENKPGTTKPSAAETRFVPYKLNEVLVEGQGNGKMVSRNLPLADVRREGLKAGDWVVASDPDWPELNDRRIGKVQEIRTADHMMAEIEITPERDLMRLREVMVLTKKK
jgi:cell shape-determining protein MreC